MGDENCKPMATEHRYADEIFILNGCRYNLRPLNKDRRIKGQENSV